MYFRISWNLTKRRGGTFRQSADFADFVNTCRPGDVVRHLAIAPRIDCSWCRHLACYTMLCYAMMEAMKPNCFSFFSCFFFHFCPAVFYLLHSRTYSININVHTYGDIITIIHISLLQHSISNPTFSQNRNITFCNRINMYIELSAGPRVVRRESPIIRCCNCCRTTWKDSIRSRSLACEVFSFVILLSQTCFYIDWCGKLLLIHSSLLCYECLTTCWEGERSRGVIQSISSRCFLHRRTNYGRFKAN